MSISHQPPTSSLLLKCILEGLPTENDVHFQGLEYPRFSEGCRRNSFGDSPVSPLPALDPKSGSAYTGTTGMRSLVVTHWCQPPQLLCVTMMMAAFRNAVR